jgi:hypothetical protein
MAVFESYDHQRASSSSRVVTAQQQRWTRMLEEIYERSPRELAALMLVIESVLARLRDE